ncbi:hypothetical protein TNCV_3391541 [Trichonephila clavipes]|nr:hypothetical protein TNCV_3391541 [Trichonephila clavipes]
MMVNDDRGLGLYMGDGHRTCSQLTYRSRFPVLRIIQSEITFDRRIYSNRDLIHAASRMRRGLHRSRGPGPRPSWPMH